MSQWGQCPSTSSKDHLVIFNLLLNPIHHNLKKDEIDYWNKSTEGQILDFLLILTFLITWICTLSKIYKRGLLIILSYKIIHA